MNALGHIPTPVLSIEGCYTSASSQVSPILWISFLMTPLALQFVLGQPGSLLNPGTSQYSACCGIRWWSIRIRWPSQRSLLSLIMFLCCVARFSPWLLHLLSFQETPIVCFFEICGEKHSVFWIVLQLMATILHCIGGLIELLTRIAAFLLLNLSSYSARSFSSNTMWPGRGLRPCQVAS